MYTCVCLPGALFMLAVFSPGHTQAWISQEPSPYLQQLFHSQPQYVGSLAEQGGNRRSEESCGNGVRGTMLYPRVIVHFGGERMARGQSFALVSWKPWLLSSTAPNLRPGSSPTAFVDLYACWETAGYHNAGQGVWASLAAPGLAQTPLPDRVWWGLAKTRLAVP